MATSGIKTVVAEINGQTVTLTYNNTTKNYEATVTSPATSSFNVNAGHYYPVTIKATDMAGNQVTKNDQDPTLGASLKLKVVEKVAPTVVIVSPTNGSYVATQAPVIVANMLDTDSGVDTTGTVLKIDNQVISTGITYASMSGGMKLTCNLTTALTDGQHTISIQARDNDGNMSVAETSTITVMSTAPVLSITAPVDNLATNNASLNVVGTTGSDIKIKVKLGGVDQGAVTVNADGTFTKTITLTNQGENKIDVVATNLAGLETTVSRNIIFDTAPPVFNSVTINPNPVDSGATFVISIKVTD